MRVDDHVQGSTQAGLGPEPSTATDTELEEHRSSRLHALSGAAERLAESVFLWPAVLALLFLSIFPLIVSLYVSLARFRIAKGGLVNRLYLSVCQRSRSVTRCAAFSPRKITL